jgi:hypothetical protein
MRSAALARAHSTYCRHCRGLLKTLSRCLRTVPGETCTRSAMSALEKPFVTRWTASASLGLKPSDCRSLGPVPLSSVTMTRQPAEQAHGKVMGLAVGVNCSADLGHPQFDAEVGKDREHELELRP